MIGRRGERGSGISVLAARHDDDSDMGSEYEAAFSNDNKYNQIISTLIV